jgi:hypothetical protein
MRGLCNLLIIYEIFVPNISSAEFFIAIAPFNVIPRKGQNSEFLIKKRGAIL